MIKLNFLIKQEKGISLLYVIFITSILLSIAFGINRILISQVKMLSGVGQSVVAFYAADSGIERILVDWQNPNLTLNYYNGSLANGATYHLSVYQGTNPECDSEFSYCIKSIGEYRGVRRAIEINY